MIPKWAQILALIVGVILCVWGIYLVVTDV